ncbi:MAG: hypothetical protein ACP5G2_07155 [Candidatus Bipolaricaulaceae bacterium]
MDVRACGGRWGALRELPRPADAEVVWVETSDQALHFLDAVVLAADGLANVRREYRLEAGRKLFKVYVSPGGRPELTALLRRAGNYIPVGEITLSP